MSKNPKEVFEVAATVGLGTRSFTPRAMAVVLQGVKEAIDELRNGSENNSHIKKNSDDISGLLEQIKALQDEVAALKNIKVTKKNESVTKRKGTT